MGIALRPHQIAAVDAVEAAFAAGIARPLIDACVGAGKSLMYAELARRANARGQRVLICAHTRELVEQNAEAAQQLGLEVGINAAALDERAWRGPVISAAVQSVFRSPQNFGPIDLLCVDEAHLLSHADNGMYRDLHRGLGPGCRLMGGSGTTFRLQGGSLVEGEGAPFDSVVYRYSILDGIRDGYLCEAFSIGATEKIDPTKLKTRQGEFTGESQDAQMIAAMDNHIAQIKVHGENRRAWLIFEASTKATQAMTARLQEWGIAAACVLGDTPAGERAHTIAAFKAGRLKALVNLQTLTTGFNVPEVDLLVMRRRTKSLGLYIQILGRSLRTAPGKQDCAVLDFAGNIDQHGPLDCIRPLNTKSRLVSCEECGKRNAAAAMRCWACDAELTKNCPACLVPVSRGVLDCPACGYDMRAGAREQAKPQALLETPSGAALLSSHRTGTARAGGWIPIRKVWSQLAEDIIGDGAGDHVFLDDADGNRTQLWPRVLEDAAVDARWIRYDPLALLIPNGASRTSAIQVNADGSRLIVPLAARAA